MAIDEKKHTAKEMFEALGYKVQITPKRIKYIKASGRVIFNLGAKYMSCHYREYDIPLLQAIKKQCQELGWIE